MNKHLKNLLLGSLAAAAVVTGSYAGCYFEFWEPQCVSPGSCYGTCTPQGCSQSTCLIATSTGYEWGLFNTYAAQAGSHSTRYWDAYSYNRCSASSCKVWNNCTQQYEYSPINGCSCEVSVKRYMPLHSGCL